MSNAVAQRQESAAVIQAGESATILQVIQRAAADPQCDIEKMERSCRCMSDSRPDRQSSSTPRR